MSCYGCLTKFSFFTREHSCPSCGYSYCSKCLKEKVILANKPKNVCKNCYQKITSNSDMMASSDTDIPDLLLKRLERLENPAKPPITIFRHSHRMMNLKSGLSSQDKEILERLERLKAERTATILPDENEIKRRLALLQDRSEESIAEKPQPFKFIPKSQQEEVDELLNQYLDETYLNAEMESKENEALDEIQEKLKKLRGSDNDSKPVDSSTLESEDEEAVTARIVESAIAEGELEKKLEKHSGSQEQDNDEDNEENDEDNNENNDDDDDDDDDDLDLSDDASDNDSECPWCIICNENATIKCLGCDKSLYCDSCFKQGHEFFNMEEHQFIPYERKNSSS